jgi:ornithine cyclodeaminase/alanine dehydrogenase-like protein (mu-crystallin family)
MINPSEVKDILYLTQKDVISTKITRQEIISLTEQALTCHGQGAYEMPPKPGIHTMPNAHYHAMLSYVMEPKRISGIKWISCFPDNHQYGLDQLGGLTILNHPDCGLPYAIMDCAWLTAQRTAAVTAVCAKQLARKDAEVVAIIGAGVQGREHLLYLTEALPNLKKCKIVDKREIAVQNFIEQLGSQFSGEIIPVSTVQEAVKDADLIITATAILDTPNPIIEDAWLKKEGVFYAPLDLLSCFEWQTVSRMDKVITDSLEQTSFFAHTPKFPNGLPDFYAEVGEIVCGRKKGRGNDSENIMAINIGMSVEDMVVSQRVYELAIEQGLGIRLPLPV